MQWGISTIPSFTASPIVFSVIDLLPASCVARGRGFERVTVCDLGKAWVGFVSWVDVIFDLGHEEFADAGEVGEWGDFVTRRHADRGGGEGEALSS